MLNQIISQYADTIIFAVIAIITGFVGKHASNLLKYKHLDGYVSKAVKLAEQYLSTSSGQEKYKYVVSLVAKEAQRVGLKSLTGDKLSAYIEAAVHDLHLDQATIAADPAADVPVDDSTDETVEEAVQPAVQAAETAVTDEAKKVGDLTLAELKQALAK
jgi:hypothetical protein